MKKVQKKIKKNWKPYRNKRNLKCIVFFRVDKNGKLINYSMQTPSENERFNKAAIKAIEKSQPFDPIPPDFPDETLDISFSFDIQ